MKKSNHFAQDFADSTLGGVDKLLHHPFLDKVIGVSCHAAKGFGRLRHLLYLASLSSMARMFIHAMNSALADAKSTLSGRQTILSTPPSVVTEFTATA
ncbi:hypothetical protein [Rubritalea tangerina]|uniref:hypothetical protein n=1 Tax=Rubritalea tangerina TaxID=430798 RepID=UPI00360E7D5F